MNNTALYLLTSMLLLLLSCKTMDQDHLETNATTTQTQITVVEEEDRLEGIDSVDPDGIEPAPTDLDGPSEPTLKTVYEADKMVKKGAVRMASSREDGDPVSKLPAADYGAGQITAGEWNDLQHWDSWKELLKNQDFNDMQAYWKIFPRTRYTVFATNKYEIPLPNVNVELLDGTGKVVWQSKTDNAGKAELWHGIFEDQRSFSACNLHLTAGEFSQTIEDAKTMEEGVNHIVFDIECKTPTDVDVMLVVDATGSMGDEIRYLQSELEDVVHRIESNNKSINLRTGAIFYRDENDEYLTRSHGLTGDHKETIAFIGSQNAQGGGDYPEAVDAALNEALAQDWSEAAVAKIIFLVLDAPPHNEVLKMDRIRKQIVDAAAEGIKIIPVTASGINRPTEFLMKFMAIATNGTYVFITDHSGIGGVHLDPVVKDYKVEKLNDLMVRLIYHYTKSHGCNANEPSSQLIRIYPNPTSNYVVVNSEIELFKLEVLSSSGKLMFSEDAPVKGENRIDLGDLVDGVYTIFCRSKDGDFSLPIIVVSG